MRVHVTVPATSANLGPGFDVLGLALDLVNEVEGSLTGGGEITVDAGGEAPPDLRDPERNMVAAGYRAACDRLGVADAARGVHLVCTNRIPLARGLGSSAAAALAGVLTATALHHAKWGPAEIIDTVTALEGHPDNGAAALLGGLVICVSGAEPVRVPIREDLQAVLFIPNAELRTADARQVVPDSFSRADAVHNLGRIALLIHAFESGEYELLRTAMEDRWHQPYRGALIPALPALIDAAQAAGARGAALSGAGPTVIALTDSDPDPIAQAMRAAAHVSGLAGSTVVCALRDAGATVERLP